MKVNTSNIKLEKYIFLVLNKKEMHIKF